ncbi:MAG: hypothetical protein IPI81_08240 [Flavobacteriales bacterium]|nr:hypothetical protein [Flavobacteriales bacterium]MCC6938855.1 hypothetical protein [Flavobacteriales bacterium]
MSHPRYHILPGMRPPEVLRCAWHDKVPLVHKMMRPFEDLRRRHLKGDRTAVLEQVERYTAPSGNRWIVVLRARKSGIQVYHFVWYRGTDNRIRAMRIRWDGGGQAHFSWHVLEQYAARFSPDVEAEERLLQFVTHNYDVAFKAEEIGEDNTNMNMFGGIRQGLLFGVLDEQADIVYITTFVDHSLFFPDQIQLMEQLDFQRFMGSLSDGQRQAILEKRRKQEGGEERP